MYSTLLHQAVTIFILAGWCLLTTGVGRLCLRAKSLRYASRGETIFLSFEVGLTVTGYTVFILGSAQSLHTFAITTASIALALLALAGWCGSLPMLPTSPGTRSAWDRPAAFLLGVVLLTGFLLVLTPETGKDALIYHLAVPKLYLKHQGFYFISGNIFAGYPLLGEMHYLLALFLQGDILAKAMHFALLCLTLLGIALFTRHLMQENVFPALGMGRSLLDSLFLPLNLSFRARMDSQQFDGILGPVFFFALPFLAGIRRWERPLRVLIAYSVPAFLFWASSAQQMRYLIPLFGLLAIVTGAILTQYQARKAVFYLLLSLVY